MISLLLKPRKDEILASWLIRNAIANGTDPIGFTGGLWYDWRPWSVDVSRALPQGRLNELVLKSGMDPMVLKGMTLEPTISFLYGGNRPGPKKVWPWVIPLGTRNRTRTNGLHFCPECLAEKNAYFKKSWRLSWNTACPKHGTLLALHCPKCHMVFSPHLVDYRSPVVQLCPRCGFDLRKTPVPKADGKVLRLQEAMNGTLENGMEDVSGFGTALTRSEVPELFAFVRDLAAFFRNLRRRPKKFEAIVSELGFDAKDYMFEQLSGTPFDAVDVFERHRVLGLVSQTIRKERDEIVGLLRSHGVTRNTLDDLCNGESATMRVIRSKLTVRSMPRKATGWTRPVKPKSKEEVEAAMERLGRFL